MPPAISVRVAPPGVTPPGSPAPVRVHGALTAAAERRLLQALAQRAPAFLTSDQLTCLGLLGQLGAGAAYAAAHRHPWALWLVNLGVVLNWLGDSLDGTLARVRNRQRPRYGFYVDHVTDVFGASALLAGLAASGLVHGAVAAAMLVGFLLLAAESYLAAYTLHRFALSQGPFGPTELRLLLLAGNAAVVRHPAVHILGHRVLLFDLGGGIGAAGMVCLVAGVALRHAAELRRAEAIR
jgi:archaetidylinositol phosphate synthase